MNFNVTRQFDLRRAAQRLAQNLSFDLQLVFVAGMLVMTSTATSEIWAGRANPVRRWFEDLLGSCPGKSGFLFGNRTFDSFSSQNKREENGFSSTAAIGRQASETVAPVDQFVDGKKQN